MLVRRPVVAGHFYPSGEQACRLEAQRLLEANDIDPSKDARLAGRTLVGGLVPHAGWTCSGATAAKVLTALKHGTDAPEVIVLFGGVHRYRGRQAAVFGRGEWETPIGSIPVDSRLAERVIGHTNLIVDDPFAHEEEHSLEVQTPFLKHLFPESKILPIMVPIEPRAAEVGQAVARTLQSYRYRAVIVGTTDLTHYGPAYGFVPAGVGRKGNEWAKRENDVRFIELLCRMETDRLVAEAAEHRNACNAGAAAATVAAVKSLGATEGVLLEHTTSAEVLADRVPGEQTDSVGYAGIVYVRNH